MVFDILDYIKGCPCLSDFNLNVDFLGKNPYSLSVGGRCKKETVRTYTDGDELVNGVFTVRFRLPYGVDMDKNLDNCRILDEVSQWFLQNSAKGILPELSDDKIPVSISADFSYEDATYLADTVVYTAKVTVLYYKTKSL